VAFQSISRILQDMSGFALKIRNPQTIADEVFPRFPVTNQSDKYVKFDAEQIRALKDDVRAEGAAAQRVTRGISRDSYFADDHAHEVLITDEERARYEVGSGNVEQDFTELLMDKTLLRMEKNFAAIVTDAAQVTQNTTLAGPAQWSDTAGSKPVSDVQTGHEAVAKAIGRRANALLMGFEVFSKLRVHPSITSRISNIKIDAVSEEDLAALFDVDRVLVSEAIEEDAAAANQFVFGKHAVLCYINPGRTQEDVNFGRNFVWAGAAGTAEGIQIEIARAAPVSRKADELASHFYYDQNLTTERAGYLIKNAVA